MKETHWICKQGYRRKYHFRICDGCELEIRTTIKSKGKLCKSCHAKTITSTGRPKGSMPKKVYHNFCFTCYERWTTTKKRTGLLCKECTRVKWSKSARGKSTITKPTKVKKPKKIVVRSRVIPKEVIEEQRKINKKHRATEKAKKVVIQTKSDSEMVKEFLETSTPSVIDTTTKTPHLIRISLGSGTSVLG